MKNITEIASGFLGDLVAQNKEGKKMWLFMTVVEIYLLTKELGIIRLEREEVFTPIT